MKPSERIIEISRERYVRDRLSGWCFPGSVGTCDILAYLDEQHASESTPCGRPLSDRGMFFCTLKRGHASPCSVIGGANIRAQREAWEAKNPFPVDRNAPTVPPDPSDEAEPEGVTP